MSGGFSAVRVEGGLFGADLLVRVKDGDPELPGVAAAAYGLDDGVGLTEAAGRAFAVLTGAHRAGRGLTEALLGELGFPPDPDTRLWHVRVDDRTLRIHRGSAAGSYVEFDLAAIVGESLFPDFLLLYTMAHATRFAPRALDGQDAPVPEGCLLERWYRIGARDAGRAGQERARDVLKALDVLGADLLRRNPMLAVQCKRGTLSAVEYRRELLRLVHRLVLLFSAEDRGLLLRPDAPVAARSRYDRYFSMRRLRDLAARRDADGHTDPHGDLWRALVLVFKGLGDDRGLPELGLPSLGGPFRGAGAAPEEVSTTPLPEQLLACELSNEALLTAVRLLSGLGTDAESLFGVFEHVLESPGTPTPLVEALLDTAVEPIIERYASSGAPDGLLALTVCDPACGSGRLLVAAARRIARRYAVMSTGEPEPPPERTRRAMRLVVGRCLYGVDIDPLAADLAKAMLWIEAVVPGERLPELDGRVKVGDALFGATPRLLDEGVPDRAFHASDEDDAAIARAFKARNARELRTHFQEYQPPLFAEGDRRPRRRAAGDARLIADAWCASFVWPKRPGAPEAITSNVLWGLRSGAGLSAEQAGELARLAERFRFFHWHLEFPEIFRAGDEHPAHDVRRGLHGGFDCVLGDPPWAGTETSPAKDTGAFPLTGRGRPHPYALFAERAGQLAAPSGRAALLLPSAIATGSAGHALAAGLERTKAATSVHDFGNDDGTFPDLPERFRFCVWSLAGPDAAAG